MDIEQCFTLIPECSIGAKEFVMDIRRCVIALNEFVMDIREYGIAIEESISYMELEQQRLSLEGCGAVGASETKVAQN